MEKKKFMYGGLTIIGVETIQRTEFNLREGEDVTGLEYPL